MSKTLEQALEIYQSVSNKNDLKVRAQGIYKALDGLMGEENIAKIASAEDEFLRSRLIPSSIGTEMSENDYNKLIRKIPLVDKENAYQYLKKDGSTVLKHFFYKYCGLSKEEWDSRNSSDRVYNRLKENIQVDPVALIQTAFKLLESKDIWEVGAGLIAASGRRPHEIVARAKFFLIEGEKYKLQFEGQGKKRGENPIFPISVLVPADIFLRVFKRFQSTPEVKSILEKAKIEAPNDIPAQNQIVDKLSNKLLNRAVKRNFKEILPPRSESGIELSDDNEADINNTALKSAYLAIATKRDCEGSPARQMLFASKLAGHFIDVDPDDRERVKGIDKELQHVITTLAYMSYHIKGEVPCFEPPERIPHSKLPVTRLRIEDNQQLDAWCKLWKCSRVDAMSKIFSLAQQALATPAPQPIETEKEIPVDNTAVKELEQKLETYQRQTEQKIDQLLQLLQNQKQQQQAPTIASDQPQPQTEQPQLEEKSQPKQPTRDWESVSKAELFGKEGNKPAKGTGATEERIRRAVEAIMLWNNQFPHDQNSERKWSINNRAVRDLAGVNGIAVKEWLENHHQLVSDHNAKHSISDVYHNRCHKAEGLNPDGSKRDSGDLIKEEVYPLIK